MNLRRRLERLERQTPRRRRDRAELTETICQRLMRRAEQPDGSVASRIAQALAEGNPEQATAILTNHMER